MKSVFLLLCLIPFILFSQTPQGLNFQTILRDNSGKVLSNRNANIRISLLQGGVNGVVAFSEEHRAASNEFGLVNAIIGYGFPVINRFDKIDWSTGSYFLKIEIDPSGGTNYELNSISPLLSVPYALYSEKVNLKAGPGIAYNGNTISAKDSSAINEIQSLSLVNNELSLSKGGGTITLPVGSDNWGSQTVQTNFSLKGNGTSGNPLSLNENSVSTEFILNGSIKKEDLEAGIIQDYSAGPGIRIDGGLITNIGDLSPANELQTLSYNNNTHELSISGGNTIVFPAGITSKITDLEGKTYIDVEKLSGDHLIRFGIEGEELMTLKKNAFGSTQLHFEGPGSNLFIGRDAGLQNDARVFDLGFGNSYVGQYSGVYNTKGSRNVGLGTYSLWGNKLGKNNVAIGYEALLLGEEGSSNCAIGFRAMNNYQKGNNNIAIGSNTLMLANGGNNNIAIGVYAQAFCQNRNGLISIGDSTLFNNGTNGANSIQGIDNIAIGSKSMYSNTKGSENIAVGTLSLYNNMTGDRNTAVGVGGLFDNTQGHSNTAIGYHAMFANDSGYANVALGSNALSANVDGALNIAIGSTSMFGNMNGNVNTAVGSGTLFANESGSYNTAIGYNCLHDNYTGINNTAIGSEALLKNYQGIYNTAIGSFAMYNNTNGYSVTAVGKEAGSLGTQNQNCTYLGDRAMNNGNLSFQYSTAIGSDSRVNASYQIRIGDPNTLSIGGYKSWTNISDGRYKKDVRDEVAGLDFIMKLKPVCYILDVPALQNALNIVVDRNNSNASELNSELQTKKSTAIRQTGFIAQDVEQAAKDCQFEFSGIDKPKNDKDFYGLRYAEFVVPIVKALQEQQLMINIQKTEIEKLKRRIDELEMTSIRSASNK